ncbi:MAG: hypothetical protein HRF50_07640 [Phycisphaerae bacterium]|jgi:hypothetical protein
MRVLRYAWAAPTTMLGLAFLPLALLTGGGCQYIRGVLEVYGGGVAWLLQNATLLKGGAAAMTLGHVILGVDRITLECVRAHERIHVRQSEHWGPMFIPAYLLAAAWAWARGGDPYFDNRFEREAYRRARLPRVARRP